MKQQQPQSFTGMDLKGGIDLIYLGTLTIAGCFIPVTRYGLGRRAIGAVCILSWLYMLCYAGLMECAPLFYYMGLWMVASFTQLFRRNRRCHSYFGGYPVFCKWFRYETGIALEMVSLWAVGIACLPFSQPLAVFFIIGGLGTAGKEAIQGEMEKVKLQEMADAEENQRYYAQAYDDWKRRR